MEVSRIYNDEERLLDSVDVENIRADSCRNTVAGLGVGSNNNSASTLKVGIFVGAFTFLVFGITVTAAAEVDLVYYLVCNELDIPSGLCLKDASTNRLVTNFTMWSNLISGLIGVTVSPLLTALSDRIGRKKVLLFSVLMLIGTRAGEYLVSFGFSTSLGHWWLLAPQLLLGLAGSFMLPLTLSISYVSDLVPPENRARAISIIDAGVSTALAFSPMIGSFILKATSLKTLFKVSLGLLVTVFIIMLAFVEESLPPRILNAKSRKRQTFQEAKDLITFKVLTDPQRRMNAILLLVCSCLSFELVISMSAVLILYVKQVFSWSAVEIGYLVTVVSTMRTLAYLIGFPVVYKYLKGSLSTFNNDVDRADVILLRISIMTNIIGQAMMSIGFTEPRFLSGAFVESIASIGSPSTKNAFLKYVSKHEFGAFMAVYGLLNSVLSTVLPASFLKLYEYSQSFMPTLPFMVLTACFVGVLACSFFIKPRVI